MVFLDNASTTKIDDQILKDYVYFSTMHYLNPSAIYKSSQKISEILEDCKKNILFCLSADRQDNFIFTSGATESNNMAIKSFAKNKNIKMLFSITEHPSVYNVANQLKNLGFNVEFINVTKNGVVDIDDFKKKLTDDVGFVSIIHVNNETGVINDIKTLVEIVKNKNENIIFHSDGVQAFGKIDVNISKLGVDLYTISAHKMYGPKGCGGLFIKRGVNIKPLFLGGGQEKNLRSGTENTPAIFAFSKCVTVETHNLQKNYKKIKELNQRLLNFLKSNSMYNVHCDDTTSPYIISFNIKGAHAEPVLNLLEDNGFLVGNGSACSSKHKENRILNSIGLNSDEIKGSLRVSFGKYNTLLEVENFILCLNQITNTYLKNINRG